MGTLTVEGTSVEGAISASPNAENLYGASWGQALWVGGEVLTFGANGMSGSDFSGKTVVAPAPVTITAPTWAAVRGCASQECPKHQRSDALTVSWAGLSESKVLVEIGGQQSAQRSTSAECAFASADGTAEIPVGVMEQLPEGVGSLSVKTQSLVKHAAGNRETTFLVVNRLFQSIVVLE
ncbi:MAG: hypothetical protein JNG84_02320 [Archangium sp.]|nr:hypothetical protein [Archangium sp.]